MVAEPELPVTIQDALKTIRRHPRVLSADTQLLSSGNTQVVVNFDTDLPSRWKAQGRSPTDIRPSEPVYLVFGPTYPTSAPGIWLRQDFNRDLPHINPHREGGYVPPCVVFGGTTEVFHQEGLESLLNHTAEWLRKAGRGELINLLQGWEPVRRDETGSYLVFDPVQLAGRVSDRARHFHLKTSFIASRPNDSSLGLALATVSADEARIRAATIEEIFDAWVKDEFVAGSTLTILCCPGKMPSGKPFVCDKYLPETVATIRDLIARADAYGCGQPLRDALSWLRQSAQKVQRKFKYPLFFILAARRPTKLIHSSLSIELLAYRCNLTFPIASDFSDEQQVEAVAHCHPVTTSLLRRMSGIEAEAAPGKLTMLGCGSVGSKIGTHLARAGLSPYALVDSGTFRPHNSARHALFPGDNLKHALPLSKAAALA